MNGTHGIQKLWCTRPVYAGATICRHESRTAAYRYIQNHYCGTGRQTRVASSV